MDIASFTRILTAFCDPGTSVEVSKGTLLVQVNDRTYMGRVHVKNGEVHVDDETGEEMTGTSWLIQRIAKLHLLADRILQFVPETKFFVNPEAYALDNLQEEHLPENVLVPDVVDCATSMLSRRIGYTSSVVYLTSDAGEGKTTVINELARQQAQLYKARKTDWLLVPIALGGRPFMRFDDVIAGNLTNRLRFPLFYFDAFIELVKLGVLVPAFDGFEETLVVNASGDAYSAIGHLMAALEQQGTVLISARKAFFDYQDLNIQARLYDSIGTNAVVFSRIQLRRWKRSHFERYASLRSYPRPSDLFDAVAAALHSDEHALLTRAVLANRLVTVASEQDSLTALLRQLGSSPSDYFPVFVNALIEREVAEKWLTSAGEVSIPLLSVEEHRDMLAMVAQEMWVQATDSLKPDLLELIGTLYCESRKKTTAVTQQVVQWIKQHALLVPNDETKNGYSFDHEEFKHYFLGLAIASLITSPNPARNSDLTAVLRRGALPNGVVDAVCSSLRVSRSDALGNTIEVIKSIAALDPPTSFMHENAASLTIRLLSHSGVTNLQLEGLTFGGDALQAIGFEQVTFRRCTFRSTATAESVLKACSFEECMFDRLDLSDIRPDQVEGTRFSRCSFVSIVPRERDLAVFDPTLFDAVLRGAGFQVRPEDELETHARVEQAEDGDFALIAKLIKCFSVRTHITEGLIRMKFGTSASYVLDEIVRKLERDKILYSEARRRGGSGTVYKIAMNMSQLQQMLEDSMGSSSRFYALADASGRGH